MKESTRIYLCEQIGGYNEEFLEMLPADVHSELDSIANAKDCSNGVRWRDRILPSRCHFEFALDDLKEFGLIALALHDQHDFPFSEALCRLHYYEFMFVQGISTQEEFGVYIMENTSADLSEEIAKKFFRPVTDRKSYQAVGEYYSTGILLPIKTEDGLTGAVVGTRNYSFEF